MAARKNTAGQGERAHKERLAAFKREYLSNGHNAKEAAIAVGLSPKTAKQQGMMYLKKLEASGELAKAAEEAAARADLKTDEVLGQVRAVVMNDPRRFYREDGTLKPVREWDADMAACVSSVEVDEIAGSDKPTIRTSKIKFWSKVEMVDKAMKHLGLFEKDNRQKQENLVLQVNFVGAPGPHETATHRPGDRAVLIQPTLLDGKRSAP